MIVTIDCDYTMPRYAAAYLLVHEGRAAFVDNNTALAVPLLLKALADRGLSPEQVELCIITHVHLDHAGGSSALMKACSNATLVAHPRAARHVIDPSKLIASAQQVYGEARFRELYGEIEPIAEERVQSVEDGSSVDFAGRKLLFLHTRGHANHHFVVVDEASSAIFTGDAFGLCYPDISERGLFAFPSTSPTDFDAPLARDAVRPDPRRSDGHRVPHALRRRYAATRRSRPALAVDRPVRGAHGRGAGLGGAGRIARALHPRASPGGVPARAVEASGFERSADLGTDRARHRPERAGPRARRRQAATKGGRRKGLRRARRQRDLRST
ncbi:MAG: MBL fold metallo-hydrolase [Myxococcales bacterium]|nr:MBL fold metallo-hydrolase [Myxococcales bacterium]